MLSRPQLLDLYYYIRLTRDIEERLVLLYVPPYRPWLNPLERRWRPFRREVTHGELFVSLDALGHAARAFVDRYTQCPHHVRSIIGSHAA